LYLDKVHVELKVEALAGFLTVAPNLGQRRLKRAPVARVPGQRLGRDVQVGSPVEENAGILRTQRKAQVA
jgi:hypothetical protein